MVRLKHPGALGGEGAGRGVSWGGQNYQPRPPPQAEVRVIREALGSLESPLDSKEIKPVNKRKSTLSIHWKD